MILEFIDGSKKEYKDNILVKELAESISISLAKKAVGAVIDNNIFLSLHDPINVSGKIKILTKEDKESLKLLNHSGAHLLAHAVKRLYPEAKFWVGPAIDEGFYYDIDFNGVQVTEEDLEKIEHEMKKIVKSGYYLVRKEVTKEEAQEIFKNDFYKLDLINQYDGKVLTTYTQGDFIDLCRGGHSNSTSDLKYTKLISLAGAYWKGDASNHQLTRIYGISFWNEKDLNDYLTLLQERKERDHRKIGKEQKLFMISKEVGQGLPFWLFNGSTIRRILERYIVDKELKLGYNHVYTPVLANVDLYKTSGHWDHYKDSMFPPMDMGDGEELVLRPMNCPHHMMIYKMEKRSYKDLPLKIAELGMMHRYEKSGALSGLQRVREMVLNDAHVFVRPDQIKDEFSATVKLILDCYKDFNITKYSFRLSYHDPKDMVKYYPNPKMWEKAESMLKEAMDDLKLEYVEAIGEAAFYGPKLDIQVETATGHEETLSTIQLDFLLPERFDLKYVGSDGSLDNRPVVVHRGVVSTMERFTAYLIEEYKGRFPLWLSPNQVVVIPVNNNYHLKYSEKVYDKLFDNDIRVKLDKRDEKLGYKIREHQMSKVNYQVIIGDNEVNNKLVTYRKYGSNESHTVKLTDFVKLLKKEIKDKKHE